MRKKKLQINNFTISGDSYKDCMIKFAQIVKKEGCMSRLPNHRGYYCAFLDKFKVIEIVICINNTLTYQIIFKDKI